MIGHDGVNGGIPSGGFNITVHDITCFFFFAACAVVYLLYHVMHAWRMLVSFNGFWSLRGYSRSSLVGSS